MKQRGWKYFAMGAAVVGLLSTGTAVSAQEDVTAAPVVPGEVVMLSHADTTWRYLDDNTDPALGSSDRLSWAAPSFDDSAWKTGVSAFGAKRGAATGMDDGRVIDTLLTQYIAGSDQVNVPMFFFRTSFELSGDELSAIKALSAVMAYDDGASVYLNGKKAAGLSDSDITENLQHGGSGGISTD